MNKAQIIVFLFSPDIWGTVSDWCMVGVTIVTAFYLYHTLKSQRQVQQTQNDLFEIEQMRFRESIKPILDYEPSRDKNVSADGNKTLLTINVTNETDNRAEGISFHFVDTEHAKQIFIPTPFSYRKHLTKGEIPLQFHFMLDTELNVSGHIAFSIKYQDVSGTKYQQSVFVICDKYGIETHPSLPQIIG